MNWIKKGLRLMSTKPNLPNGEQENASEKEEISPSHETMTSTEDTRRREEKWRTEKMEEEKRENERRARFLEEQEKRRKQEEEEDELARIERLKMGEEQKKQFDLEKEETRMEFERKEQSCEDDLKKEEEKYQLEADNIRKEGKKLREEQLRGITELEEASKEKISQMRLETEEADRKNREEHEKRAEEHQKFTENLVKEQEERQEAYDAEKADHRRQFECMVYCLRIKRMNMEAERNWTDKLQFLRSTRRSLEDAILVVVAAGLPYSETKKEYIWNIRTALDTLQTTMQKESEFLENMYSESQMRFVLSIRNALGDIEQLCEKMTAYLRGLDSVPAEWFQQNFKDFWEQFEKAFDRIPTVDELKEEFNRESGPREIAGETVEEVNEDGQLVIIEEA